MWNIKESVADALSFSLLEEVTSQLTSIQEALRQRDISVHDLHKPITQRKVLASSQANVHSMSNSSEEMTPTREFQHVIGDEYSVLGRQELGSVILESGTISDLIEQ